MPSVVFATSGYDQYIRLWEATSGICYRSIAFPDSQINKLDISPDKSCIAAAGNPNVQLFDLNSGSDKPTCVFEGHNGNVTSLGFDKGGQWLYTGSEDGLIKIWDVRAPGCQREFESRAAVNTVALHPNQTELVSGDQHGNIRVWDLAANACSCELVPELNTAVRSVSISLNGTMVVAANNNGVCYVWKLMKRSGSVGGLTTLATHFEPHAKLQAHDTYVLKCLLSPDMRVLATASADCTVRLWNVGGGFQLVQTLTGHSRWVWDCVFSVDAAYLVTASSDTTAKLWELASGEPIRTYSGHSKTVVCCALNDSAL